MKSEAKTKTINLRAWMFLKIAPAALLLLYYWMYACTDFHTSYLYVQSAVLALAGGLFAYQLYYAKRRDIFDEFARENLRTTDSICLKIACGVLVLAAVLCVFSDFSGIVVGYALLIGLLALTVARAVLFTVIDKRGM